MRRRRQRREDAQAARSAQAAESAQGMQKQAQTHTPQRKKIRLFHRYPSAPRKSGPVYFAVSFILSVCLIATLAGILLVDRNTRMVGWSENRVELAFSSTDKSLQVTLAGRELTLRAQPFEQAGRWMRRLQAGAACVESPQARLAKIAFAAGEKPAADFFGRICGCVVSGAHILLGG